MKYYVYRFSNSNGDLLYIGKTIDLKQRMQKHFTSGHLEEAVYKQVKEVEYIELSSEVDQYMTEIYLINKFQPPFNSHHKFDSKVGLSINYPTNWKPYYIDGYNMFTLQEEVQSLENEKKLLSLEMEDIRKRMNIYENLNKDIEKAQNKLNKLDNALGYYEAWGSLDNKKTYKTNIKRFKDLEAGWYTSELYNELRDMEVIIQKLSKEECYRDSYVKVNYHIYVDGVLLKMLAMVGEEMLINSLSIEWDKIIV